MSSKPVILPKFIDPDADVTAERDQARSIAHQLLTAASTALATGKPPQWPPLPRLKPEFDAIVGAALGAMARSITPKAREPTRETRPPLSASTTTRPGEQEST